MYVVWRSQAQAQHEGLSQAYIAICTRCRNIAVQSDCRMRNYNILTSGENSTLCYSRGFVKHCIVANIQKVFEKQSELGRGRNWATMTRSLNSKTYVIT